MHDPLNPFDLVADELAQLRETGHDVGTLATEFEATDPSDCAALERILASLSSVRRDPGWQYEEPDAWGDILDSLPPAGESEPRDLADQVLGGWLGRISGNNVGKPVEQGDHWTVEHIRDYLERADAYPLRDYVPLLDPMPPEFELRENWPFTLKGLIDGAARDDDIDYAILALHLMEKHGPGLQTGDVAAAWLSLLPYWQVYTAERAAYTNLVHAVPIAEVATTRNPYREWIGALIRGDAFGWAHPGRPRAAMALAYQDAALSHVGNGIYGELWAAALQSEAFSAATVREAFDASLQHVPPRSRLAEALRDVAGWHDAGAAWDDTIDRIREKYGHYSWVHTVNNAAIIAAGLLWGEDDLATTVGLTVMGGWDTDSNAATAGAAVGVVVGARALPPHLVDPLRDSTRSALFGFDYSRISDLASRTTLLATRTSR
ncbi:MAG TPA: ADP-ribosylglycohydrolase family protein [Pseudolysinimonas sp.]|jgi:ADP-ribosylglycohydrolase|nr:ADP-ribosylglycohydrolase family protein [Pseudolysinimonas sp.]